MKALAKSPDAPLPERRGAPRGPPAVHRGPPVLAGAGAAAAAATGVVGAAAAPRVGAGARHHDGGPRAAAADRRGGRADDGGRRGRTGARGGPGSWSASSSCSPWSASSPTAASSGRERRSPVPERRRPAVRPTAERDAHGRRAGGRHTQLRERRTDAAGDRGRAPTPRPAPRSSRARRRPRGQRRPRVIVTVPSVTGMRSPTPRPRCRPSTWAQRPRRWRRGHAPVRARHACSHQSRRRPTRRRTRARTVTLTRARPTGGTYPVPDVVGPVARRPRRRARPVRAHRRRADPGVLGVDRPRAACRRRARRAGTLGRRRAAIVNLVDLDGPVPGVGAERRRAAPARRASVPDHRGRTLARTRSFDRAPATRTPTGSRSRPGPLVRSADGRPRATRRPRVRAWPSRPRRRASPRSSTSRRGPRGGEHRLGVELHALDAQLAVAHPHHHVVASTRSPRARRAARRGRRPASGSAPRRTGPPAPRRCPVPTWRTSLRLAVDDLGRRDDRAAEGLADRLVPEADPEDRHAPASSSTTAGSIAGVLGAPGPGREHDRVGRERRRSRRRRRRRCGARPSSQPSSPSAWTRL